MTYEEIARVLGVSRERVRQIEARALRKLRRYIVVSSNGELRGMISILADYNELSTSNLFSRRPPKITLSDYDEKKYLTRTDK